MCVCVCRNYLDHLTIMLCTHSTRIIRTVTMYSFYVNITTGLHYTALSLPLSLSLSLPLSLSHLGQLGSRVFTMSNEVRTADSLASDSAWRRRRGSLQYPRYHSIPYTGYTRTQFHRSETTEINTSLSQSVQSKNTKKRTNQNSSCTY